MGKVVCMNSSPSMGSSSHQSHSSSDTLIRLPAASMKVSNESSQSDKKRESPARVHDHDEDPDHELSVDLSKLFIGRKFARGAHSQIYHGIYHDEAVAVKMVREEEGALAVRLEKQYNTEISLLSRLHHTNVIKLVGSCRQSRVYCVVTEYIAEGSLRGYLDKHSRKSLPFEKLISIALDIARGMEYVHSKGVIHRDLKPDNILVGRDFGLKIADFGVACEEGSYDPSTKERVGTYRWMAPEVVKSKPYGRKVDVYSFGLVLWELVAGGRTPFEGLNPIQTAVTVAHRNLRPTIPKECPDAMRALIEKCWALQPDRRPQFRQIVKVLEKFQSSSLTQLDHSHNKNMLHWIYKFGCHHHDLNHSLMHKPKFLSNMLKSH